MDCELCLHLDPGDHTPAVCVSHHVALCAEHRDEIAAEESLASAA